MKTTQSDRYSWQQCYFGESIKLVVDPDNDYDPEFKDCDESIREDMQRNARRYGVWFMTAYYKCPCCGNWTACDSIGEMVYSDIWDREQNGYINDLVASAQSQIDEIQAKLIR